MGRAQENATDEDPALSTSTSTSATGGMSFAFGITAYFFLYAVALPVLLIAWLGVAAFLSASAGLILFHSGTFEPRVFAHSAKIAMFIDGMLLLGMGLAWLARRAPAGENAEQITFYEKYPATLTAVGLLAVLGAGIAFSGATTSPFADRLTTIVTLTSTYFFALLALGWMVRQLNGAASAFKRWTLASAYRAGAMTMLLLTAGLGGFFLRATKAYEAPLSDLREEVNLAPLIAADGPVDFTGRAMCLAANEAIEEGVSAIPAPQCTMLLGSGGDNSGTSGASEGDAESCFKKLHPSIHPTLTWLQQQWRVHKVDAEDAVAIAMLATCTRVPLPADLPAYFKSVSRNQLMHDKKRGRRNVFCEEERSGDPFTNGCDIPGAKAEHEAALARLWESSLNLLDERSASLVKARMHGEGSFRELGARLGMTEVQARTRYNNAIKKLRRLSDLNFFEQ